jgi:predicted permease
MESFLAAFFGAGLALLKVALVVVAAGVVVRRGWLTQAMVTALSQATVRLFLPCLMFANIVRTLDPTQLTWWWMLPLIAIGMSLVGLGAATVLFGRGARAKRHLLPLAAMQNAGYLILPVGLALEPERFDTFALYCFLFILGFNPWLWSVGKHLTTSGGDDRGWRGLITPPLVATVGALALVLTGGARFVPDVAVDAIGLVGDATVPVATVVLGAVLGTVHLDLREHLADSVRILAVKFAVLPAITVALLTVFDVRTFDPLLARFLVLESAAAPAANIILMVRTYGGHERVISDLMLRAYLACALALPAWLAIWEMLG